MMVGTPAVNGKRSLPASSETTRLRSCPALPPPPSMRASAYREKRPLFLLQYANDKPRLRVAMNKLTRRWFVRRRPLGDALGGERGRTRLGPTTGSSRLRCPPPA